MSTATRLSRSFENVPTLPLTYNSRYVLFSDCHRGCGSSNDNFLKNRHLYFAALNHYYRQGFTYVELGDGDELWENRDLKQIIDIHSNVYQLLTSFYKQNRLYMLYGNHDMVKKQTRVCRKCCSNYYCTLSQCQQPLFPDMAYYSGLILKDCRGSHDLYLTHGHQAELLNSTFWRVARFLVRYVWVPLEHFGILDPTSAAKNYVRKDKSERRLIHWAQREGVLLITGHTHRPRLAPADAPFFNTGSCVHPHGITCIEIENRALTLVKWALSTRCDRTLYVAREVLAGPFPLDFYPCTFHAQYR